MKKTSQEILKEHQDFYNSLEREDDKMGIGKLYENYKTDWNKPAYIDLVKSMSRVIKTLPPMFSEDPKIQVTEFIDLVNELYGTEYKLIDTKDESNN